MRSRHHSSRSAAVAVAALGAAAVGVMAAPSAGAEGLPTPIGPHQYFAGQVNGVSTGAVIKVGCFGPVTATSTGHPLAGQTVAVQLEADATGKDDGYTGESADHVAVEFESLPTSGAVLQLHQYGVTAEIPTALSLPCEGSGTVLFVPGPTSGTARSAAVAVTYVNAGL
ncbi:hypothetical protein [Streptomyces sp. NPDC020917]|uniref:hypothetical protein n=1 Tax=Streptomyces sp. NPDC020917 TaxID=3365102 RepID=UPI0037A9AE03